jgi:hypothetical protein
VRSVTCMHALLLTHTLMDSGGRGMGELCHAQERVGQPSLALPRPILSRKHREFFFFDFVNFREAHREVSFGTSGERVHVALPPLSVVSVPTRAHGESAHALE